MTSSDTNNSRSSEWAEHIQQWQQSRLSGAAYCQQQGLTYHQFVYWKQKLLAPPTANPHPRREPSSALVKVAPLPASGADIKLVLPSGLIIDGLHAGNLHLVARILEQL